MRTLKQCYHHSGLMFSLRHSSPSPHSWTSICAAIVCRY